MKITKTQLRKLIQEVIKEQSFDRAEGELAKKDPFALRRQLEKAVETIARDIDQDFEMSEGRMMDDRFLRDEYAKILIELGREIVQFKLKVQDLKHKWNKL